MAWLLHAQTLIEEIVSCVGSARSLSAGPTLQKGLIFAANVHEYKYFCIVYSLAFQTFKENDDCAEQLF